MSDLSRLLDDVYGDRAADAAPTRPEVPGEPLDQPEWSADAVLDEAFAEWVTDPTPLDPTEDQEPTEPLPRQHIPSAPRGAGGVPRSSFTDLAEEPVTATVAAPAPAPVPAPTRQTTDGWHREDDDILPTGRRRRSPLGRSAARADAVPIAVAASEVAAGELVVGAEQPPEPTSRRFRLRRG